jgi:WD40 repeat protein
LSYNSNITSLSFSSDGRRIITSSRDGSAKVWNAENGRELLTLKLPDESAVNGVAVSSDGRRIVTAHDNKTAHLWIAAAPAEMDARGESRPAK